MNITGGTTQWIKYKNIKVQGSYELAVCFILDELKNQEKILDWEYTSDRISYVDVNGKIRSYLFDFKVFENNKTYYIESKGRKTENDELKWKAAKDQGIDLHVWFLKDIQAVQANLVEASV